MTQNEFWHSAEHINVLHSVVGLRTPNDKNAYRYSPDRRHLYVNDAVDDFH